MRVEAVARTLTSKKSTMYIKTAEESMNTKKTIRALAKSLKVRPGLKTREEKSPRIIEMLRRSNQEARSSKLLDHGSFAQYLDDDCDD